MHVLDIKTSKDGEIDVVNLGGALDTANVDVFNKTMQPLCEKGARIVVDCAGLTYVNSTCFALFNKYSKMCSSAGGRMVFCRLPSKIMDIIKLLGLDNTLAISKTHEDALSDAQKG